MPDKQLSDGSIGMTYCVEHTFAKITILVSVAKLERFSTTRAGTRGRASATHGIIIEGHLGHHGGISPRIKHLKGAHIDYFGHLYSPVVYQDMTKLGCALTTISSAFTCSKNGSSKASGSALGPSHRAFSGFGCDSRKRAATPTATPARASSRT